MIPNEVSLSATTTIGFLGAGQLARMSALQAYRFGFQVAAFTNIGKAEPLTVLTPKVYRGSFDDVEALTQFAKQCDVVTLENEFLDSEVLWQARERSGTPFFPSPETFRLIENKLIEKETFRAAGIPVVPFSHVYSMEHAEVFGRNHGYPFVMKSSKGGYDGYGNATIRTESDIPSAWQQLGGQEGRAILAEAFVRFEKELAVQVARNHTGVAVYPCCESIQSGHICKYIISPAPISQELQRNAQQMAIAAVEAIDGIGIYAFEFFMTADGELLLNESAPRPHNSGHYTIEACVTSQFENHIRAVTGLPLGSTAMRSTSAVMVNLLGKRTSPAVAEHSTTCLNTSDAHLHLYGKLDSKLGRKMGHITLLGDDAETLLVKANAFDKDIQL